MVTMQFCQKHYGSDVVFNKFFEVASDLSNRHNRELLLVLPQNPVLDNKTEI